MSEPVREAVKGCQDAWQFVTKLHLGRRREEHTVEAIGWDCPICKKRIPFADKLLPPPCAAMIAAGGVG